MNELFSRGGIAPHLNWRTVPGPEFRLDDEGIMEEG